MTGPETGNTCWVCGRFCPESWDLKCRHCQVDVWKAERPLKREYKGYWVEPAPLGHLS